MSKKGKKIEEEEHIKTLNLIINKYLKKKNEEGFKEFMKIIKEEFHEEFYFEPTTCEHFGCKEEICPCKYGRKCTNCENIFCGKHIESKCSKCGFLCSKCSRIIFDPYGTYLTCYCGYVDDDD